MLRLSAAWTSSLGVRYVAASAYNQNLTVNGYVRVDVVAAVTPYATIGLAGSLSAYTVAAVGPRWYAKRKRGIARTATETSSGAGKERLP
jgi:opacity protein-like surface antigen